MGGTETTQNLMEQKMEIISSASPLISDKKQQQQNDDDKAATEPTEEDDAPTQQLEEEDEVPTEPELLLSFYLLRNNNKNALQFTIVWERFAEVLESIGKQKSQGASRVSSGPPAFELKAECCE
jgi:hypothetical protein